MSRSVRVVAVTACVSGVAHTYMAAAAIRGVCEAAGHDVRVETQGALGIEGDLTEELIAAADVVVLATDITIAGRRRFDDHRLILTDVAATLRAPERLAQAIERISRLRNGHTMEL